MLNKEEVRRWALGMRNAAEVIKREKWARLRSMTTEESYRIFCDLCEAARKMPPGPGEIPEKWRVRHLVRRQRAFQILSQRMNKDEPSR